jgi:hypothetical protein
MFASRLAADIGPGVIKVPLPLSVIKTFGCRPGTSIFLHVVDGQVRVVPDLVPPVKQAAITNDAGIAESCRRWWKSQ